MTISDAQTLVDNSGVANWDWDGAADAIERLVEYVYRGGHDELTDDVLSGFIRDVLHQDPSDYSLHTNAS